MTDDDYPPLPAWAYHPLAPLAAFAPDAARKQGDWEPLIRLIREDGPITDDVRAVILDIITGKLKRPKGRPEDKKKPLWYFRIAYAAEYLEKVEKWKNTAAVTQIAKEFDVHERTVKRAIAFAKAREQQEARWEGRAATMINIASETLRSNPGSTVEQVAKDLEVSVYLVRYAAGMSANDAARWRAVEAAFQKALASGN